MAAAQAGSSLVQSPDGASAPFSPGSYLCFESSKSGSSKRNKVIKLVDITDIQKVGVPSTPALPHQPPSLQEEGSRRAPELMGGVGRHTGVWRGGRVLLGDQALLLPAEGLPPRRLYRGRPCTGHAPSGASPPPRGQRPVSSRSQEGSVPRGAGPSGTGWRGVCRPGFSITGHPGPPVSGQAWTPWLLPSVGSLGEDAWVGRVADSVPRMGPW